MHKKYTYYLYDDYYFLHQTSIFQASKKKKKLTLLILSSFSPTLLPGVWNWGGKESGGLALQRWYGLSYMQNSSDPGAFAHLCILEKKQEVLHSCRWFSLSSLGSQSWELRCREAESWIVSKADFGVTWTYILGMPYICETSGESF